jgi:hypothetical protein
MSRKGFIGGSDCVRIMQGDWLELWQIKTGRSEGEDLSENIAVQLGIHTERFNLNWFEMQNKCILSKHQLEFEQTIGTIPVRGTIDAMLDNTIVEAKHTNGFNNMNSILELYMPQVQTYCQLANADGAHLSVIFGNNKWESAYVARDQEYFDSMWAVVSDFWGYVLRDEEPVAVNVPTLSIDKIAVDNMVRRDASADNHFISRAHDYIQNEAAAKTFDNAKKDLKAMVGEDEREVYCDLLTVKRNKAGSLSITVRKE